MNFIAFPSIHLQLRGDSKVDIGRILPVECSSARHTTSHTIPGTRDPVPILFKKKRPNLKERCDDDAFKRE